MLLLMVGCADETGAPASQNPSWPEGVVGAYRLTIEPGGGAEIDLRMRKGQRIDAEYRATGNVLIEAHAHLGDEIITFGQRFAPKATGRITAEEDGRYSFLWAHAADDPTATIELVVVLRGEAEVHQWLKGIYDGDATLEAQQLNDAVETTPIDE